MFRLGDFLSYRIREEQPGRLLIEVRESVMDKSSGDIGARTRLLSVSWKGVGDQPPATLSLMRSR